MNIFIISLFIITIEKLLNRQKNELGNIKIILFILHINNNNIKIKM